MLTRFSSALLVATFILVGCGAPAEPTYLTADATDAEYIDASATLDLPAGAAFPDPNHASLADDGNAIFYERGSGRNDAQYFWYCAWAAEATTAVDPSGALANMERVESMELWRALDDNGRAQFANQLELAKVGDLRQVESFVDVNCHADGT